MADDAGKRPFWMHQLVEYLLGGGLVATGVQSTTPLVPTVVGGLLLLYAACTKSPVAAFRLLSRRMHRVGDPVVVAIEVLAAVQPWIEVDASGRLAIGGIAFVHLVVWWQSTYTERVPRAERRAAARRATPTSGTTSGSTSGSTSTDRGGSTADSSRGGTTPATGAPTGDRATDVGRTMGRAVARGIVAARRRSAGR